MFAVFCALLKLTLASAEERIILILLRVFFSCCISLMFLNYGLDFENWFVLLL